MAVAQAGRAIPSARAATSHSGNSGGPPAAAGRVLAEDHIQVWPEENGDGRDDG
ncbi:hypothetical protein [Streptomyces blattellae]|uniref:hypothetical protein n=1 Tax=Streptomyces blattellae TaxID=2569855 RepID=UPI0018ACB349|nr:hypothetical protein [Streptomyces blattellae]